MNPSISSLFQTRQLLPLIVPYLSVADVFALSEASPFLARTIAWCLDKGMNLTIDRAILQKYSVSTHPELFSRLGPETTSVTLRNVQESDIAPIFTHLKHVTHLRLIGMFIVDDISSLPKVKTLELIHMKIEKNLLEEWFKVVKFSLKSLKIDNLITSFGIGQKLEVDVRNLCFYLEALEIKMSGFDYVYQVGSPPRTCFDSNYMKTLKVVNKGCNLHISTSLENVYCDGSNLEIENARGSPNCLKSITLKSYPTATELGTIYFPTNLEHLKILDGVDPKHRQYLTNLWIKSMEIFFYEYATEKQENLIQNMLDDDSLIEISKYLPLKDSIEFAKTDPRIFDLIKRHRFTICEINNSSDASLVNNNRNFFKEVAPFIKELSLKNTYNVTGLIPYCSSLTGLCLHQVTLSPGIVAKFPKRLHTLKVKYCDLNLNEYLVRVEGIRVLWLSQFNVDSVQDCLFRNRDSIQELKITMDMIYTDIDEFNYKLHADFDIWSAIASLPNLTCLKVCGYIDAALSKGMQLEEMTKVIPMLSGVKLLKLNVELEDTGFGRSVNSRHLKHLEELEIWLGHPSKDTFQDEDVVALSSLKNLKALSLVVSHPTFNWPTAQIMKLIQALSQLTKLNFQRYESLSLERQGRFNNKKPAKPTVRFGQELQEYLVAQGRQLCFNGHQL